MKTVPDKDSKAQVLIAEDDPVLRRLLKNHLDKFRDRYETILVEDGLEAIHILQQVPVSLLVTDLKMPKVDGVSLLAYMSRNCPTVPCVIITAHSTPILKKKLEQDVFDYLEKPIEMETLSKVIEECLKRSIPNRSAQSVSLVSFLQLIKLEGKTCLCEIESQEGITGWFFFQKGLLCDAAYGGLKGEDAARAMIRQDNSKIFFQELSERSGEHPMSMDVTSLILEAVQTRKRSPLLSEAVSDKERTGAEPVFLTEKSIAFLNEFDGYLGAAVLDRAGIIQEKDSRKGGKINFQSAQKSLLGLLQSTASLCEKTHLGQWREISINTPDGLIFFLYTTAPKKEEICLVVFYSKEIGTNLKNEYLSAQLKRIINEGLRKRQFGTSG